MGLRQFPQGRGQGRGQQQPNRDILPCQGAACNHRDREEVCYVTNPHEAYMLPTWKPPPKTRPDYQVYLRHCRRTGVQPMFDRGEGVGREGLQAAAALMLEYQEDGRQPLDEDYPFNVAASMGSVGEDAVAASIPPQPGWLYGSGSRASRGLLGEGQVGGMGPEALPVAAAMGTRSNAPPSRGPQGAEASLRLSVTLQAGRDEDILQALVERSSAGGVGFVAAAAAAMGSLRSFVPLGQRLPEQLAEQWVTGRVSLGADLEWVSE